MPTHNLGRRLLVWALRLLILAAVIFFVGRTFRHALGRLDSYEWQIQPLWLIAAGVIYVVGSVPMALFWQRILTALGQPVPWHKAVTPHFLGHLGKYVPGKAMVVVLRIAGIRRWLSSTWLAVVSTVLETMMMMAVGAFLAALFAASTLQRGYNVQLATWLVAAITFLPTLPPIARWFAHTGLKKFHFAASDPLSHATAEVDARALVAPVDWRLWATGWLASLASWMSMALSLWCVIRSIGVETLHPFTDLPLLIGAVTFAVVAGFISFLPGGVLVRDALILQLLTPACGEANALVAAVLLRLVWLVSEVLICGILYIVALRGAKPL